MSGELITSSFGNNSVGLDIWQLYKFTLVFPLTSKWLFCKPFNYV